MRTKKLTIGRKVNGLLLFMVSAAMLLAGGISIYSLYSMKQISTENGRMLGQTAADDVEEALEELEAPAQERSLRKAMAGKRRAGKTQ